MIANLATATPAEIDTRFAAVMVRRAEIEMGIRRAEYTIDGGVYVTDQAKAKAETDIRNFVIERNTLIEERETLDDEYRGRGGWTRYYLVTNTGGHVHTSTSCDTCFDDTDFGWLTQFSGTEQDEMGNLSGEAACARCFPNLPAEVMQAKRDARIDTPARIAAREEREAAAAARDAKKATKAAKNAAEAITNPDGTPVLDGIGYEIKRESKVRSEYIEDAAMSIFFGTPAQVFQGATDNAYHVRVCGEYAASHAKDAQRYLAALAHKAGVTTEEMATQLDKKVQAKVRSAIRGAQAEMARWSH